MQTKSAHNGNNIESRTIRGIRIAHEARTKSETRIPHGQWPSPPVAGPSGAGTSGAHPGESPPRQCPPPHTSCSPRDSSAVPYATTTSTAVPPSSPSLPPPVGWCPAAKTTKSQCPVAKFTTLLFVYLFLTSIAVLINPSLIWAVEFHANMRYLTWN